MLYGYTGKLLYVNLSTSEIEVKDLCEEDAKNFIGGPGLAARILYREMPANTDPFDEESVLIFMTGPAVGTGAFFGNRFYVVHKSPVYNGFSESNGGGLFAGELKKAGFDGIVIRGIAEKPVYLHIKDGQAEIKDASPIWGKEVGETDNYFAETYGIKRPKCACIGPAGEVMCYFAAVMTDKERAAARGGTGAVMGSKKLKAILCEGSGKVASADPEAVAAISKEYRTAVSESPLGAAVGAYGTAVGWQGQMESGLANVKNWGGSVLDFPEEQYQKISPFALDKYKKKAYACLSCPLHCGAVLDVTEDSPYGITTTPRPEYENFSAYGSALCLDDPQAVLYLNHMSNEYGVDTISAGNVLSWVLECYEKGALTKEDLDGIEPTWGNKEAAIELFKKMCHGEGCGEVLKLGTYHAAKTWGKGEEYMALACGMEIGQHDPRIEVGTGRIYAYDPAPGRHYKGGNRNYNGQDFKNTGYEDVVAMTEDEVIHNMAFCSFGKIAAAAGTSCLRRYINAVTGFGLSDRDIYFAGIRSFFMRQAFTLREGQRRKDWWMSDRLAGRPAATEGPVTGRICDYEKLGDSFYAAIGCDVETGVPTTVALTLVGGLDDVMADLYPPEPAPEPAPAEEKKEEE